VTVAIVASLLDHVPPVLGDKLNVDPIHTSLSTGTVIVGEAFTMIVPSAEALEQPVVVFVKITSAVPADIPVTSPVLVISAMLLSLLVQVPPVEGVKFNTAPSHTSPPEGRVTVGVGLTVITPSDARLEHPEEVSVYITVTVPAERPSKSPALSIAAMVLSLLIQVPPVDGVKFNVSPMHNSPPLGTVIGGADGSLRSYTPLSIVEQLFNDTSIGE
jgi:hypothetical protein